MTEEAILNIEPVKASDDSSPKHCLIITVRDTPPENHLPELSQPLAIIIHGCFKPVSLGGFVNTGDNCEYIQSILLAFVRERISLYFITST